MEEKIIWKGSSSQIINLGAFLLYGILFVGITAAALIFKSYTFGKGPLVIAGTIVLMILPLIFILVRWMKTHFIQYEFSSERIRITTGIFSRNTSLVELYRVKDYILEEPFWFRVFKLGNIILDSSDPSTPKLIFRAIPGAKSLLDEIRKQVEARRDLKRVRQVDYDEIDDSSIHES